MERKALETSASSVGKQLEDEKMAEVGKKLRAVDFLTLEGYSEEIDIKRYVELLDRTAEERTGNLRASEVQAVEFLVEKLGVKEEKLRMEETYKLLTLCGLNFEVLKKLLTVFSQSDSNSLPAECKLVVNLGLIERPVRALLKANQESPFSRAVVTSLFNAEAERLK